jgi:hypothetical protein
MDNASLNPGRDLDALVAERVFGVKYELIHGDYCIEDPEDSIAYLVCPEYSSDIAAAFQLEERIEEIGLSERYAYALVEIVIPNSAFGFLNRGASSIDIFAVAHASPAHRCIAALTAMDRQATNP